MIGTVFGWWVSLFSGDWAISGTAVGFALGIVVAVLAVLLAGNAIIWPLVGLKTLLTRKPVAAQEPASTDMASDPA